MIKKVVILLTVLVSLYGKGIIDSRVIGGEKLDSINGKEYVVSLQRLQYGQYNAFCGGALIDETHIITAAHCITDDDIYVFANYHITPGGQQIAQLQGGAPGGPIKGDIKAVTRVFKNKDFGNKGLVGGDIAVLEIGEPIKIDKYLQLPTIGLTNPLLAKNQSVELLGWGLESHTSQMPSNTLKSITIKTLTPQQCKSGFFAPIGDDGDANLSRNVHEGLIGEDFDALICAGGEKVGQTDMGACSGDSGGPLIYNNGGISTLIGVVSSGASQACTGKIAGNFSKVEKYLDFIRDARRGVYMGEGVLRLGYIQSLPKGFNLVGTQKEITAQSKIISKDVKTIYMYSAMKRKWQTFQITNGVLPADFNIPPKYGFWLYK